MGLTERVATTAGTATLIGAASIIAGLHHRHLGLCATGAGILTAVLLAVAMLMIRRWVSDTEDARRHLAEAAAAADAERDRYRAAHAALAGERARLAQDLAVERSAAAERLADEREALDAELEQKRAAISSEGIDLALHWVATGRLHVPPGGQSNLIRLSERQHCQDAGAEPARARDRGAAHPGTPARPGTRF